MTGQMVVDEREIDRVVDRATPFLRTLSLVPRIRHMMSRRGYDSDTHRAGWQMVMVLNGQTAPDPAPVADLPQIKAVAELDIWDGPAIQMMRATCARFPEQGVYLLKDLKAASGYGAVTNAQTLLDRVAALRDGTDPKRSAQRERDRQCVDALAARNIVTPDSERHLRALIAAATGIAPDIADDGLDTWQAERQEVATKLKVWLAEWRGMARALFTRRDDLIRLGLAQRRSPSDPSEPGDDPEGEDAPTTPPSGA